MIVCDIIILYTLRFSSSGLSVAIEYLRRYIGVIGVYDVIYYCVTVSKDS